MSISAVALFGSRARNDHEPNSDTDLLLVTSEPTPRHVAKGNLSLSFYPIDDLVARAQRGDLFVCHIVREAKPVYDPERHFATLRSAFVLRKSYALEVEQASDLGWFLVRFGEKLGDASLVTRRIAWCIRTILIARSAERGEPVFSVAKLATFAELPIVQHLIRQKGQSNLDSVTIKGLRQFLSRWGLADPISGPVSEASYASRFGETSNDVALQVLRLTRHETAVTIGRTPIDGSAPLDG
jgi:hypothetical protein